VLFAAPVEAPESPDGAAPDEELESPVPGFDSEGVELPPDSLLSAFLRDSDG
jgi:hypothetical protein